MGRIGNSPNFGSSSAILAATLLCALATGGCVQRTMTVTSDPPGALVWMNGQEVGRTPLTRDFTWYGTYDVQLRRDGYETLRRKQRVTAPIWQWPPIDLLAELWPWHLKDQRHLHYAMTPASTQPVEPMAIFARADELSSKLESSQYTRKPTTTTAPSTRPTTAPATTQSTH